MLSELRDNILKLNIIIITLVMKKSQEFLFVFCRAAKMDFHHLARTRNVSVDLKYDVLSGEYLFSV